MLRIARIAVVLLVISWPRVSAAADLTLAWDPPTDGVTTGYTIFYGTASHAYSQHVDVGYVTSYTVTGLAPGTTYYFVVVAYDALGHQSSPSDEVEGSTDAPIRTNVALASNGGLASASTTYSPGYAPAGANNGDRRGQSWGSGGGWNDATPYQFPDTLEIQFNGMKTIEEIDVFSVQDNYQAPVEPTPDLTFNLYGLRNFDVQYWTGTAWQTVTGGSIVNNSLVWRQVTFDAIATTGIRVVVNAALNAWSPVAEIEAWTVANGGPGGPPPNHPPTVTLTGPPDGSLYAAPATVPLTATASDPDVSDTIDHVTFYANGSPIGTSSVPVAGVYSYSWTNVGDGPYALTAVSFDNHGAPSPTSSTRNITVTSSGGSASAVFVTTDTTTQGNWPGRYGDDGYSIVGDVTSLPAYATLTPSGALQYTWAASTSDGRALARVDGGRVAATWYSSWFDLDVNITSGTHQVVLYCIDWDTTSRSQRIDVLDVVTSAVLDTRTVTSFNGGKYLSWNVTGHVQFRITTLAGINAVVSAVFFGPGGPPPNYPPTVTLTGPPDGSLYTAPATVPLTATASDPDVSDTIDHVTFYANGSPIGTSSVPVAGVYSYSWTNVGDGPYALTAVSFDSHGAPSPTSSTRNITVTSSGGSASAVFVTTDTTTQGNWPGRYGDDGYSIVGDVTSLPAYATLTPSGALQYTWAASTSDGRALARVDGGRVAATWYSSWFDLDVNITSGTHQVVLYCIDWDTTSRSQRIDVLDVVTSAVLDTRTVTSFNGGKYLSWNVTGHVQFRITTLAGINAVVSAVFFGPGTRVSSDYFEPDAGTGRASSPPTLGSIFKSTIERVTHR